jgi:cytochrome P450/NADPH-cytochrome P450 reductase
MPLGEPADNAAHFVQWLQTLSSESLSSSAPLKGTSFAVFGCGNREWASTYQRIPRLVDEILEKSGAERVFKRGEADVSAAAFFEDWEEWEGELWKTLGEVCKFPSCF